MAVATGNPINQRRLIDATYRTSIALPATATTANTNGLDLIQSTPYPTTERIIVNVAISAANGANNKNLNVRLQYSTDNSTNWTNIAEVANPLISAIDNNGAGFSATQANIQLPPYTIGRYLRAQAQAETNGGNAANGTVTLTLFF